MNMKDYQVNFLRLAIQLKILQFGQFRLKSGRLSPYFFNMGLVHDGSNLLKVAQSYAAAVIDSNLAFEVLFGPAYKGIPLVSATSIALAIDHNLSIPFAYNRKEAKDHGEGGQLVGADLTGKKVLIIDDVMTAGTAIREAIQLLKSVGALPAGILIALDREEKGVSEKSTIAEFVEDMGLPVFSIVKFSHILSYIQHDPSFAKYFSALEDYRKQYGC